MPENRSAPMTLRDVAAKAGVSTMTLSRVLNTPRRQLLAAASDSDSRMVSLDVGIDGAALCPHVGEAPRPYADRLTLPATPEEGGKPSIPVLAEGFKNGHSEGRPRLKLVAGTDVSD